MEACPPWPNAAASHLRSDTISVWAGNPETQIQSYIIFLDLYVLIYVVQFYEIFILECSDTVSWESLLVIWLLTWFKL